jgi:hypothetical protein
MWHWVRAALLTLMVPALAQAAILKFDDPTIPGGTVSYDGAGGPAVGTDILFQSIQGLDTPLNSGVTLACDGCLLDFITGANLTEGPALWNFGPGGTLTLTGAVPALGLPAGTLLLVGSFAGTPNEITDGDSFGLFAAVGTDVKNETLAAFYGLGVDFTFGTTSIQTTTLVDPATGAFSGTVVNADLNNVAAVPNSMSVLLLGMGIVGLVAMRRRA